MTNEPQTPTDGAFGEAPSAELVYLPGATKLLRVTEYYPDTNAERDPAIEALWYSYSDQMSPVVAMLAVPPVIGPGLTMVLASRIAAAGATVSRSVVVVADARGLVPADREVAMDDLQRVADSASQTIVVLDAPTVEPAAMPLIEACGRIVIVVELSRSRRSELRRIEAMLQGASMVGAVYIDRPGSAEARAHRRHVRRSAIVESDEQGSAVTSASP